MSPETKSIFIVILILVSMVAFSNKGHCQSYAERQVAGLDHNYPVDVPSVERLKKAIMGNLCHCRRNNDGKAVMLKSCTKAHGGCEARIEAFTNYMLDAAEQYNLNPWLLAAVAYNESRFNPFAVGPVGERGIFQLHPRSKRGRKAKFVKRAWYRKRCIKEIGNCQEDIVFMAADHLRSAIDKCDGSLVGGLSMYNTGRCEPRNKYVRNTARSWKLLEGYDDDLVDMYVPSCQSKRKEKRWNRVQRFKREKTRNLHKNK